ncbi:extracellular solute-binding protein family 1 [Solidesulfovibrio fructosivorans JJ]]|uniref:Extracellular solute-binding protein family 1 n=1 Tax=Solidesulfovibrio fructosivorans JJ] TaxID=596151 RepID=E1JSS3_SOLFR|nr:ABC transporter substrate-binding protein [Solidesulfovibrio fructosivorans]EFL52556.1 extracellular solute-binding protein family 1 [Solidesulfovibrio fructosivorans JJ]]
MRHLVWLLTLAMAVMFGAGPAHATDTAICYNCPPEWADWGTQLKTIERELGIHIPQDNKNSGQSLSQLIAEKNNPVADVVYYGVSFGIEAKKKGVVAPYKPAHWDAIPKGLKDPDGFWFAIHSGTIGFFVNKDALEGKPVPRSWNDLLDPRYKGMIGYLDPTSAFVGYASVCAANKAMGGTLENFAPGLAFMKKLQANEPIVPKQTSYARVLSGEIPILLDYDFNAYRAKYKDKANVEFVIPQEGTIIVPYVMSLVKNAPHPELAKKILDFVMSDKGQAVWANAYLKPVRPSAMSKEVAAKFLPESEYARATPIDYAKMGAVQAAFRDRFRAEVQ